MLKKVANLIDVKSLVTLVLTGVFAALSFKGTISPDQFQTVFTTVIAFYFGTQYQKQKGDE
jgi:hypothetical protein